MSESITILRIVVACGILAGAAVSDLKTRRVSDWFWVVMGSLGMALLGYDILTLEAAATGSGQYVYDYAHLLILVAVAIPFYYAVLPFEDEEADEDEDIRLFDIILGILPLLIGFLPVIAMMWLVDVNAATLQLVAVYAMVVAAYLFFYTGLLHGGADAKAFMSIAVLLPFYPIIDGALPLIQYPASIPLDLYSVGFPFAFLVIMNAAIINVLIAPILCLPGNIKRGDYGWRMLFGFKMDVDEVLKRKSFVWPMEVMRDGELVTIVRKVSEVDNIPKEVAALKKAGIKTVWVQRKYPFIVAILFGLIFSFFIGNLMMLIYI